MHWTIYTTGDKIESFYKEAAAEYLKRIGRYAKIQVLHIKKPAKLSALWPEKKIRIALLPQGNLLSSEEWAAQVQTWQNTGCSSITLVIGQTETDLPVDETLALSPMGLSQGLSLTILTEQIYRAYRIIHGQPYHK